jgi:hypothetical protein
MMENSSISIWRYMLSEGVPVIHVKDLVEKHISGLQALSLRTDEITKAIKDCEAFLGELNK